MKRLLSFLLLLLLTPALIVWAATAVAIPASHTLQGQKGEEAGKEPEQQSAAEANPKAVAAADTVKPVIPVPETTIQTIDGDRQRPGTLRNPENIKTDTYYDEETGTWRLGTKMGDYFLEAPFMLSDAEYQEWLTRRSLQRYYKDRNAREFSEQGKNKFDFTDMQFDLGPASKIFGPGGVRIKTQGSAQLKIGANMRFTDNPSLSERNRKVFGFDFDEQINLSMNAKVGDKVNMDFNYNSEATFSFDTKNIKLRYEGKEDEIIKLIEAGNVSLPAGSSLIRGASSLFGIRTDMQFGRLKLQTVISQKKSSSQSVSSRGGVQLTTFEIKADQYDENRHFFLGHYFRDTYDASMAQLPNILSGITINRVEVWVTNKTGVTSNTRHIVALADLGEHSHIGSPLWTPQGADNVPANGANSLYPTLTSQLAAARDISQTTPTLDGYGLVGGADYEKLENARRLNSSEYILNSALGYISLRSALQTDQVLAVAYEYTWRGQRYQVGEFSTDVKDNGQALFVKALRNTSCSPQMANWPLMMKNVYSLGAGSLQRDKFKFDIKILSDTTGVYLSYLPLPALKSKKILSLMGLDRLDNNNKRNPNGVFDYVEGYTVHAATGRIYFPTVEPFGSTLRQYFASDAEAEPYLYQELYDSTHTQAKQLAEKNKYVLVGEYKASKNNEIQLGSMNVPRGSVVVTAGGMTLTEGTDYRVDYASGVVTILNQSLLDAGTPIQASCESDTEYGMQRKTMFGVNWEYAFSKDFSLGGTFMHLGEKPLTTKVAMGSEPLNNTLWGLNLTWKKESQWLTNMLDRLPILHCTAPSQINFSAEFAQLVAGSVKGTQGSASYIDDFENAKNEIDISQPTEWTLCSTPSMFAESKLTNDVRYGYNRALLAWYYIDPLFTRRSSSLTPGHIKSDLKQLSDPRVRDIYKNELFPNKSINFKEASTLSVLNLAYYPNERGAYNLDPALDADGRLTNPAKRWGGMMRKLEMSDFETANIEYIEFWLMDPFITARNNGTPLPTGDLYFNLGEISEDILKDGKKYYESGMPVDGSPAQYTETVWGRVPTQNSITYAFSTQGGSRQRQDIGLNGLSSEDEAQFPTYANYLQQIRSIVRPEVYDSIVASPSADRYHYFRGTDFDEAQTSILDRYKRINLPNGNSVDAEHSPESYATAYTLQPDVEDVNLDYTLNEYEKYYQYRVSIRPEDMVVGRNFIVDHRETATTTRDNNKVTTDWYLFRIPIDRYEKREGAINDFSSIRFMRLFLTGFEQPVVLRMATFNLVHGEWRGYEQALYTGSAPDVSGSLSISAVNFEENNEKTPVNYVLPPGISRVIDPGQEQVLQDNEQALALTVEHLAPGDARAVYKNTTLDLRRYRHIQMFAHANALPGDNTLADGQTSLFIRLGSDYRNNFYEYEIPLKVTPEGQYSNGGAGSMSVWPADNMLDIDLSLLTQAKRNRNHQRSLGLADYTRLYSEYDAARPACKISVMGNPSLGEVRTVMIGVRNNSREVKSVEVWANELRLQQYSNKGGWAARGTLNVKLSDVATVNLSGHVETNGFGGIEESVAQRRDDDLYQYSITTQVDAGRFVPDVLKLKAPVYYSYSKERTVPRYNPLDTDMEMDEALDALATKAERDSLRNLAERVVTERNFSVSGLRFDIATKRHPMPYDPANFTFSYAYSHRETTGETTAWEREQAWKYALNYSYSPVYKGFSPFAKIKGKSKWLTFFKELDFNYLPQNVTFDSEIRRNYSELQERDLENMQDHSIPLIFSSDYLWNRRFSLRWDLTKNIHTNFQSGTNAEIEQPYVPVNKALYPDEYAVWKDSVRTSLRNMGTPISYQQQFDASWQVPIHKLPIFDWVNTDVKYASTYSWQRGADLEDGSTMGHTIASSRNITWNGRLKLETLYNHSPFLKEANRRFANNATPAKQQTVKPFAKDVTLRADTTITLQHNLKNKRLRVTALRTDGSRYALRWRAEGKDRMVILTRDTARVKVTVTPARRTEDQWWYKTLQVISRGLMMTRTVSVSYTDRFNTTIPGFLPRVGDFFGQNSNAGGLKPGLDFAFGLTGEGYISRAAERGWLQMSDSIINPATTARTQDLQIKATLEPFRYLKVDLSASRNVQKARSIQYMYSGMPTTQTGSFSMTTISIGSAFESLGSVEKGWPSKTFKRFVASLDAYRERVENRYAGAVYPEGTALAGQPYDPANGGVNRYASEVMIPAFLNAYTSGGGGLDIFPAISKMLPNWTLSYSGLGRLRRMRRIFRAFNINHAYRSVYSVGSYSSFTSYRELMNGVGFINDVTTGNPVPSCPFDISTVSINESFSPLIGVDMTFNNNLTAKVELRRTRVLTLSMTSQQLTEARSNDIVIGTGYKVTGLNLFAPKRTVRAKQRRRTSTDEDGKSKSTAAAQPSRGFSSDLNLRLDISFRNQASLCRDIPTELTQATSGNHAVQISFSADYALSRLLTLTAYYDRQMNKPLLTSSSYPTTTQDFGVTLKFILNR